MSPPRSSDSQRPANVASAADGLASVSRREGDGVIIAAVRGEIDVSNASEIGRALIDVPNRVLGLVVDLGQVGHLDSTGIALLYELQVRLSRRGQNLVVVAPAGGAARRVLELTAFDTRAAVTEEVEAAVTAARLVGGGDLPPPDDPR